MSAVKLNRPVEYAPAWASGETAAHCHCAVEGGICHFFYQGAAKAHSANALLCTLPSGCRPSEQTFAPFVKNANAYGVVVIQTTGRVEVSAISSTSASGRIYVNASWPVAG